MLHVISQTLKVSHVFFYLWNPRQNKAKQNKTTKVMKENGILLGRWNRKGKERVRRGKENVTER
jgi:hypothetical protein